MDILWFRIPRKPDDPEGVLGYLGRGHGLVLLDRLTDWQVGFIIIKGSYSQIRAAGLEALRKEIAALMTAFPDRIEHLKDWKQVSVLSVESSRVPTWYKLGLLLIGDAAHVMSPVGGVGINYAIQDAVVAANVLTGPLKVGRVTIETLAEVQKQCEFLTKVIQWLQGQGQKRVIAAALKSNQPLRVPWYVRVFLLIPFIGALPARLIAHGVKTVHINQT